MFYTNIESSSVTNDNLPKSEVLITVEQERKNTFKKKCAYVFACARIHCVFVEAFLYSSSQVKRIFDKKKKNHYSFVIL